MRFLQPFPARIFYGLFLLAGLGWIWFSAIPSNTTSANLIPSPQTGFLAPDFNLKTFDGQNIQLSELKGKVVIVNIWASWCPPCRAEMPTLEKVYEAYQGKGLVVLGVNSTVQDTLTNAQTFVTENKLSFPILADSNGLATRLYRVQSLPTTIFIGSDGVIHEIIVGGPMAEALLFSRVEKLIQEKP